MATQIANTRDRDLIEAVADELTRHGAAEEPAAQLAREIVGRYPLVGRLGLAGAVREARRAGLDPSAAEESAVWLAAWEALHRGVPFAAAAQQLEALCGDPQRARAALLEASRFQRSGATSGPPREPRPPHGVGGALGRRAAQAVLILVAAAGWVALGGRWLASF
ncbi:MAG: hypothetical protein ACQGVK_01080 [Myxococcota bacterium]